MSAGDYRDIGDAFVVDTGKAGFVRVPKQQWPDWMNAPVRPIQLAKLDDLQAETAEQRDWLEIVRAKEALRERNERFEREFQVLRNMQADEQRRAEAQAKFDLLQERMAQSQAARVAFRPTPKPKKPSGPPILPLDTPRRFFED